VHYCRESWEISCCSPIVAVTLFGIVLEVAAFEISVLPKFDLLVGRLLLKLGLCVAVEFPYFLCPELELELLSSD
jgi:hypothetical protein